MRDIVCPHCFPAHKLGIVQGNTITIVHRKRVITANLPVKIQCECCGKVAIIQKKPPV